MYRQHLRMLIMQDIESNRPKSEFIHRITSIPVVYLAWNIAAETYNSIKASNRLLKASLNTTEKAAYYISLPLLQKFENQLKSVDHIACRGLETLQGIVPSITHQREKFYKHTRNVYEDTIESGIKKYELAKEFGVSKVVEWVNDGTEKFSEFLASPYGEVCEIAFDFALEAGEMYVDYFLPPLGDERPEKLFGDRGKEPASKRAELLRSRLKERFYKHSLLKIQMFRLRSRTLLIKVYHFSPYQYLVHVCSLLPELIFTSVFEVFFNVRDLNSYISSLFRRARAEDRSIV